MSCAHATCTCTGRLSHPKCASNVSVLRLQSGSCVEEMATTLVLEENALQMHLHNVFRTLCRKPCTEDTVSTLLPEKEEEKKHELYLYRVFRATYRGQGCHTATRRKSVKCICTMSSQLCPRPRVEVRAVALESAPRVCVLCLQSAVPQATCRGRGCRRATRRKHVSVLCLQSAVPQATCRGQGCRRATSAPTEPTSRTRGRRCASNVPTRRTQSSEPRPPSLSAWVGAGLLSPFCFLHWVVTFRRK